MAAVYARTNSHGTFFRCKERELSVHSCRAARHWLNLVMGKKYRKQTRVAALSSPECVALVETPKLSYNNFRFSFFLHNFSVVFFLPRLSHSSQVMPYPASLIQNTKYIYAELWVHNVLIFALTLMNEAQLKWAFFHWFTIRLHSIRPQLFFCCDVTTAVAQYFSARLQRHKSRRSSFISAQ